MEKRYLIGIHVIAIVAILPFVVLAAYCHPYYDDYITAIELKRTGFAVYFVNMYLLWTGRYAFLLANIVHPLRFGGLQAYQWGTGFLVMGLAGSCYVLGLGLTVGQHLRRATRVALGSGLLIALLALFPSPAEGLYWVIGGYNYTLPILVGFGGFAAGCGYAVMPQAARARWLLLLAMLGAAALFPGFSEFSACLSLALAGGLLVAFPQAKWPYRAVMAVAGIGAVAMLAAPGNLGRLHQHSYELLVAQTALLTAEATAYTLLNWLSFPPFWILAGLGLPLFGRLAASNGPAARLTRNPMLWPLLLLVGMTGCYLFSYLAVHQPPPLRARNLLFSYFLLTAVLSLIGGVQLSQRRGWKLPNIAPAALLVLLVLSLLSDGNGRLRNADIGRGGNTVAVAYHDWLSGDARSFDAAERGRYALLRTNAADSVAVPPLPVTPVTLLYYDIGPSPGLWGNRAMAQYFGKKAIWVK